MGIISWMLLGLIAGGLAKWIYPGRQGYGIFKTMLIGIVGAMLGGFAGSLLFGVGVGGLDLRSILVAIIGSMFVIWLWERFRN
ncbi:MAG: GlsB/YeaQ/YmgE family stress response membrane protein [Bacteroidetes bacterium]|nr:GlsB/YeaQ/YmgE family stress response membrane protein [Bacteroidota bacterium]